jgi:hypothetical protein
VSQEILTGLITAAGLLDTAEHLGEGMYRLRWGSAVIVCVASGEGVVALAPMFERPPIRDKEKFYKRLLELNARFGGTAAFAVHESGAISIQAGRGLAGLDKEEFSLLLATVGKFADDHDDALRAEFYA